MNARELLLGQLEVLYETIDLIPELNGAAALIAAIGAAIAHSDKAVEAMIDAVMPVMAVLTIAAEAMAADDNARNN